MSELLGPAEGLAATREYLGSIRSVLATGDLDAPVPQCPGWDLRRLAGRTIKELGIDYLLIGEEYVTAADMRADPSRWGLVPRAAVSAGELYEIQ